MKYKELCLFINGDLHRYYGKGGILQFSHSLLLGESIKFCIWFRVASFIRSHLALRLLFGLPVRILYNHYKYKLGIDIPPGTRIGPGLYIGHFGGIVVSPHSVIGANCNLSPGVIIGRKNSGGSPGTPILGNNIYVGPGVKIIGGINVGDNCVIGANAVVVKDCPSGSIMAGIPAVRIGDASKVCYINRAVITAGEI